METFLIVVAVIGGFVVAVVAIGVASARATARKRRETLLAKYKDADLVERLINRSFWQGQTAEQLTDSLGKPEDVDEKVLKTKRKQIWRYHEDGRNRYRLKITLEDDVVVGWDQR